VTRCNNIICQSKLLALKRDGCIVHTVKSKGVFLDFVYRVLDLDKKFVDLHTNRYKPAHTDTTSSASV
jgi:hypothetical protein